MRRRLLSDAPEESDFLRRIGQTFATRVVLILITLVSSVIIARTLGPAARGTYGIASLVASMGAQFAMLGMHASNTYTLAKDKSSLPALLGNSLVVSGVAGGLTGLAVLSLVHAGMLSSLNGTLLWMAALMVPVHTAAGLLQNLYLGLYDTSRYNRIDIASNSLNLIALVALVLAGFVSAATVYGASVLVAVTITLSMSAWLRRRGGEVRLSYRRFRDNVGFSIRSYVSTLIMLLATRIDLLLIEHFNDIEAVGHFAIASTLAELLGMLAVVTGSILFPRLAAQHDAQARWCLTQRTALAIGAVTALGGLVSVPIAGPVLVLLFGDAYAPSVAPYLWLVPGAVFLSTNVILMNYFAAEGMPPIVFAAPLVAFLVKFILGIQLIPIFGISGAAIAFSISYLAMLMSSIMYIVWRRALRPLESRSTP